MIEKFPKKFALLSLCASLSMIGTANVAAATFRIVRSTFRAASSRSVQRRAISIRASSEYGAPVPAMTALSSRCVIRSTNRRFGAVECRYSGAPSPK